MKMKMLNYLTCLLLVGFGTYRIINNGFALIPIIVVILGIISLGFAIYSENYKSEE
ncbi:hypothetical protein NSQ89_20270 [Niallia sp. FSL R7-0648]|uniref:hypothetical protein n=1 Tax=Niallia sp. FSL R7-0648 TaxID=2954521 RepID=UPI0030FC3521